MEKTRRNTQMETLKLRNFVIVKVMDQPRDNDLEENNL